MNLNILLKKPYAFLNNDIFCFKNKNFSIIISITILYSIIHFFSIKISIKSIKILHFLYFSLNI